MSTKYIIGDIYTCCDGSSVKFIERVNGDYGIFKCLITEKNFKSSISNIARAKGKNSYFPSVCSFGFIGQGAFSGQNDSYSIWYNMIKRVKDNKLETYKNVSIDEKWKDFQVFSRDYYEMMTDVKFENPQLDKDLKSGQNRGFLYSKSTCLLLPHAINTALQLVNESDKESNSPCGVSLHKLTGKFKAQISKYSKTKYLGIYNTVAEAQDIYRKEKSAYIVELAEKFRNDMPKNYLQSIN